MESSVEAAACFLCSDKNGKVVYAAAVVTLVATAVSVLVECIKGILGLTYNQSS